MTTDADTRKEIFFEVEDLIRRIRGHARAVMAMASGMGGDNDEIWAFAVNAERMLDLMDDIEAKIQGRVEAD